MSFDLETLYQLLPAIHRLRDAEQGQPLKQLMAVIADQIAVLEEDLAQLYDNQFIETAAEWVVPYIGDLIGYRTLNPTNSQTTSQRSEVADTIAFRRRKGTATMLEQLARDVTGLDARVVEFFQVLITTQYMKHLRPFNRYSPDLRKWEPLENLSTPFDSTAHTLDVRRIASGRGKYNIPNVGIFLWRLSPYRLVDSPAVRFDTGDFRRYLFSPLGNNSPLFTRPETEQEITHLAEPLNVPQPVSRRRLREYLANYYGPDKSIYLKVNGAGIGLADITICNLEDASGGAWAHDPPDKYAIDPVMGRLVLPQTFTTEPKSVQITFHYAFSDAIGGGDYGRAATFGQLRHLVNVPVSQPGIQAALNDPLLSEGGTVEISDFGRYEEKLTLNVNDREVEIRAKDGFRPTIVLTNEWVISGNEAARVTLNGLLISGATIRIQGKLGELKLEHCTLVPGITLNNSGEPNQPNQPSLIIEPDGIKVTIERCIIGGLRSNENSNVVITNSIVDATVPTGVAYAGLDNSGPGGTLVLKNSTVIGKIHSFFMDETSNSILLTALDVADKWVAPVISEKRQEGCTRFSYVPLEGRVPRRFRCLPENAVQAKAVRPQFTSLRFGRPAYGQLNGRTSPLVREGADDDSEMGAFHDLFLPQRIANLRLRLDEYLRFSLEAGIFFVT